MISAGLGLKQGTITHFMVSMGRVLCAYELIGLFMNKSNYI